MPEDLVEQIVTSALGLSRAGQWPQALRLLDAAPPTPPVRLAAATVALDSDWFGGTSLADDRLAAVADPSWDVDFLRLRHRYWQALVSSSLDDELMSIADALGRTAPDPTRRGWASMYRGLIADNIVGEHDSAPGYYERALGTDDPLLSREALRHLGDHAHQRGDYMLAREHWGQATAYGAGVGAVPATLSQQMLLAVLARDTGDEAGAVALATEIARWAGALGAKMIEAQATAFLSHPAGADAKSPPAG